MGNDEIKKEITLSINLPIDENIAKSIEDIFDEYQFDKETYKIFDKGSNKNNPVLEVTGLAPISCNVNELQGKVFTETQKIQLDFIKFSCDDLALKLTKKGYKVLENQDGDVYEYKVVNPGKLNEIVVDIGKILNG